MSNNQEYLKIQGASIHNLKHINLNIPKYKLVVICGLSGSGKSSLAFDTIYNEGQRRYLEGLSSYARQFLGGLKKPEVEKIENISPTLAINQRTVSSNPRSTVGTITEIYDYLRLLYTQVGKPFCPKCGQAITRQTPHQILNQIFDLSEKSEVTLLAPVIVSKKGQHQGVVEEVFRGGWPEVRIDGIVRLTDEARDLELDKNKKHSLEVVVGRLSLADLFGLKENKKLSKQERLAMKKRARNIKALVKEEKIRILDLIKKALQMGKGLMVAEIKEAKKKSKTYDLLFSEHFSCLKCGINLPKVEPRLFSFNSPYGACVTCHGLGRTKEIDISLVLNPNLSIAEGAIIPFFSVGRFLRRAARVGWIEKQVEAIISKAGYDCFQPFGQLSKKIQDRVLYGHGNFEGIINRLERFYYETSSNYIREEMAKYMTEKECSDCQGAKLKPASLALKVAGKNIAQVSALTSQDLISFFDKKVKKSLSETDKKIALSIIKEILRRANFLKEVGLNYITTGRTANTLSVGENQRIRLATHLGSGLSGVIYVLDEPTIGLHQRDIDRLIGTLKTLRDLKNTVLVVEHDEQVIDAADHVIEIGPKAGQAGGRVTFEGSPQKLRKSKTITGLYLSGKLKAGTHFDKRPVSLKQKDWKEKKLSWLEVIGASQFNLKNINFKFPLERFVCVTGVSGSGKSTLISETLAKALLKKIHRQRIIAGQHKKILGDQWLDKIILIDQSPIGRTPRSNPATYTGLFTPIRQLFTQLQESRIRGYHPGYFSFNVKPGQCASCKGEGFKKIEMYFMPDVYVECEACQGRRFSPEVLEIKYKDKNIADILQMSVDEAAKFFTAFPPVINKLRVLQDIGLSYIKLGQPATTLSGGEAQRIKLADELARHSTSRTLYVLDEPTVGLHYDDEKKLLLVLRRLVDKNNSVLIVEHNADVIKEADWVIELGPEGGDQGGQIIFEGTPQALKKAKTWTARFL